MCLLLRNQSLINKITHSIKIMEYRIEKDTMGKVEVPAHVYWGAQTQRSIMNFPIAQDINKMPKEIIRAFAYLKKAAAITNFEAGILPEDKKNLIAQVCDEILDGKLERPISIGGLANGFGYAVEHELQRGDRLPRPRHQRRVIVG